MWSWLRRRFVTGLVVTVPVVVSVVALVWFARWADSLTSGLSEKFQLAHIPGVGLIVTALLVLLAGVIATNVFGRRVLQRGEHLLLHVPLFRTIYAPVKQLISAFSPENEGGFKRVVIVEDPVRGFVMGFLTREFVLDRGRGPESLLAVYVPTNHLYLGDIVIATPERVSYPEITVEDGVRVFLTGGMGMPGRLRARSDATPVAPPPRDVA